MTIVHLPTHLRSYSGDRARIEVAAVTVDAALHALDRRFPGIRFRVVDEADRLRPHIRIFVNERAAEDLACELRDRDEVHIVAALSGG